MSTDPVLSLDSIQDADSLSQLLCLLFEPSPPLRTLLVPSVLLRLTAADTPPPSYAALVDLCAEVAAGWTDAQKAEFLSGHPMIGEVKNLSALSGKEQGGVAPTPKVVLHRLQHLNQVYCTIFPGLRYITFVNGRSRAEIVPELETICGLPVSPQPLPDEFPVEEPDLSSAEVAGKIRRPDTKEWKEECERGLADVWEIGRARLRGMGLQWRAPPNEP